MLGIGCDFEQSLGSGAKQNIVNLFGVLQRQSGDLLREREHHVEIGHRQEFRLPLREPLGAGAGPALGAMSIAARVVHIDAVPALITFLKVAAESRGPAVAQIPQRTPLLAR